MTAEEEDGYDLHPKADCSDRTWTVPNFLVPSSGTSEGLLPDRGWRGSG